MKINIIEHKDIESHLYVVGDIHGCLDELLKMTNKILEMDSKAKFILVGDIIDRGGKSLETLQWAIENVNKPGSIYTMIMGNHEYEKIELINGYLSQKEKGEISNLDEFTTIMYDFNNVMIKNDITDEELIAFKEFFAGLPLIYSTYVMLNNQKKHYIITHAGINSDAVKKDGSINRDKLSLDDALYFRNYWGSHLLDNSIIIHGHTPTIARDTTVRGAIPGQAWFNFNDINIDCGLVFRNEYDEYDYSNFCIIKLDDLTEYYYFNKEELVEYYRETHGWSSNTIYKFEMLGLVLEADADEDNDDTPESFLNQAAKEIKEKYEKLEACHKVKYLFDNEVKTRTAEEQAEIDKAMQEAFEKIRENL